MTPINKFVAKDTAANAAAPVVPNAVNDAPNPPVVATTKTTNAATTAAFICLAINQISKLYVQVH